jgi:hypothetical protein
MVMRYIKFDLILFWPDQAEQVVGYDILPFIKLE